MASTIYTGGRRTAETGLSRIMILAVVLLVAAACLLCLSASDQSDAASSGTDGGITWSVDDSGNLTISAAEGGDGTMPSYNGKTTPWGTGVKTVVFEEGVKDVGEYAFKKCTSLKSVSFYSIKIRSATS